MKPLKLTRQFSVFINPPKLLVLFSILLKYSRLLSMDPWMTGFLNRFSCIIYSFIILIYGIYFLAEPLTWILRFGNDFKRLPTICRVFFSTPLFMYSHYLFASDHAVCFLVITPWTYKSQILWPCFWYSSHPTPDAICHQTGWLICITKEFTCFLSSLWFYQPSQLIDDILCKFY